MKLKLFGYSISLNVIILIGVLYLIMVVNALSGSCNREGYKTNSEREKERREEEDDENDRNRLLDYQAKLNIANESLQQLKNSKLSLTLKISSVNDLEKDTKDLSNKIEDLNVDDTNGDLYISVASLGNATLLGIRDLRNQLQYQKSTNALKTYM